MSHDTYFAGLTELDPGDAITVEGGAFTQKNPSRTDHYLRIGAVTHKHDAHVKLGDPTQTVASASAAQWPTGQVPADTQLFIAYTLDDRYGGETRRGPAATLTTGAGFAAPSAAVTATFVASAGTLPVGQYAYALTLNDGGGGESTLGPAVFIQRPGGFASGETLLTGLAQELSQSGIGWASWNLWRATDGGAFEIVATNQASDSFVDTGLICTDAARVPPNTMLNVAAHNAVFFALPTLASEPGLASATALNVYISLDGSFTDQCFFASFPVASAGQAVEIDALVLHAGTPPNVSLASQGASQIDPDTDLLDWHWKRPVSDPSALPMSGNASGDARACLTPEAIFMWDGTTWVVVATTAGGPGGVVVFDPNDSRGETSELLRFFEGGIHGGEPILIDLTFSSGSAAVGFYRPQQVASANTGGSATMFRALEFVGSGGTTVEVKQNPYPWGFIDPGAGSAVVTITSPSGAAGPPGASGAPGPAGASGAQGPPGASGAPGPAGASGAQGPQGPAGPQGPQGLSGGGGGGAGGVFLAGSAGTNPPIFGAESYLEFVGSGGTGVALQDLGGGSARILISASAVAGPAGPAGPQGPAGASGAAGPQGPAGASGAAGTGGGVGTDPHFSPPGSGLALGSAEVIEFYSGGSGATGTGYGYIKGEFVASGLSPNTVDLTNGLSGSFSTMGGGAFSNWSEAGGVVSAPNSAGNPSIAATTPGQFDAGQVVGKFNAGGVCAVFLCGNPTSNNYVMGLVFASNGACRIFKVVGGTATLVANSGNFPSVSSPVWVKLSKSGNVYTLAHYSSDPNSGNPTAVDSTTWTVSGGDLASFGTGVSGYAGVAGRDAANSAGFPSSISFNGLVVSPLASETHNITASLTQAASKGGTVYTKRILRDDGSSDLAPDVWVAGAASVSRPTQIDFHASGGLGVTGAQSGTGAVITIGRSQTIPKATHASGYVIQAADMGSVIESASAGAGSASVGFLIAPAAQGAYPNDSIVEFFQYGTGQVQIVPSAGVTLRSDGGGSRIAGQFGTIRGRYRGGDEWVLSGDLA